ncbi:MAG: CBS domain-containing protein [Burkholderiaceae bacterium]
MFTVYGLNGRVYSGPLEGLRGVEAVQAAARVRAVERVRPRALPGPGPDAAGVLLAGSVVDEAPASLGTLEPRQRDALAAYAQAQGNPAQPRPLGLVGQLMSRRLVVVPASASLQQGQALLQRAGVGQAPVLDAQGRLVGLLLRADLLPAPDDLADAQSWRDWLARPVAALMWTPVPSTGAATSIREATELLLALDLPGLPVLDDEERLQGFLSRSDILRALTHEPPLDLWG